MKNYALPEDYFKKPGSEIVLPGINTEMQLPRDVHFRNDGEVKSLAANMARTKLVIEGMIRKPRNIVDRAIDPILDWAITAVEASKVLESRPDLESTLAYCNPHALDDQGTAYVMAKRKGLDSSTSRFADGHESGEFLDETGQQEVLQQALREAGIDLDVSKFRDEDFADIGGLLALRVAIELGQKNVALPRFKTRKQVERALAQPFGF